MLKEGVNDRKKNSVTVCAAGMSTSLLVKKWNKQQKEDNFDVEEGEGSTLFRVSKNIQQICERSPVRSSSSFSISKNKNGVDCPIEAIDIAAYGRMDGKTVIQRAKQLIGS